MGMFDIGSRPNLHFGDEELTATIIYNDGEIAIAGTAYSAGLSDIYDDIEYKNDFLMAKEEITAFIPDIKDNGKYNSYVVIDLESGNLIKSREWLRHNDALFVPGKEYSCHIPWDNCIENAITIYRHNGTAVIKVFDGEGDVWDALKMRGYSEEEVRATFPQFADIYPVNCEEFFYICIRESDDAYINLEGNSIDNIMNESI